MRRLQLRLLILARFFSQQLPPSLAEGHRECLKLLLARDEALEDLSGDQQPRSWGQRRDSNELSSVGDNSGSLFVMRGRQTQHTARDTTDMWSDPSPAHQP